MRSGLRQEATQDETAPMGRGSCGQLYLVDGLEHRGPAVCGGCGGLVGNRARPELLIYWATRRGLVWPILPPAPEPTGESEVPDLVTRGHTSDQGALPAVARLLGWVSPN